MHTLQLCLLPEVESWEPVTSSDAAWRLLSWISPGALLSACIVAPPSPKTAPCCDHVAHAPQQDRIIAAGGRIVHNGGTKRVMGMLAMTRAIGDHYLRPYVIADPEVGRGSYPALVM